MRVKKKSLALSALLALAIGVIVFAIIWQSFQSWSREPLNLSGEDVHYELDAGKTLSHLSQDLANQKLLSHPRWLNWYARFNHKEKIHSGEYLLEVGLTPIALLDKLNKGDVILHQVTLLEGWTFAQIMDALNAETAIEHKLSKLSDVQRVELLNLPIKNLEGWFFPDTYRFSRGSSDVEILTQAYNAMYSLLNELWEARASGLPYTSVYQSLIMASIVEKETGRFSERDKIAGVFVRRLQLGMKLQTDPTVIYGMGAAYKGKITRDDLMRETPYNTYTISGLPPTPIAIPSKHSLQAALHPDDGKALYFVAKGDGSSQFSDTLVEHQRAVTRYQLQRAADYRSNP
jgi:UPF0755 protein